VGTIDDLSVSWISTRSQPGIVLDGRGSPALGRQASYLAAFDADQPANLQHPWEDEEEFSYYWAYSLGIAYRSVTANKAWKRQVPLRDAPSPALTTSLPGVVLSCDGLLFPCGTGLVVRAEVSGPHDAAGLLGVVEQLGRDAVVTTEGDSTARSMNAVIAGLLNALEVRQLGAVDPGAVAEMHPSTLATVTAATGWPGDPLVQADPVHRLLEGLCRASSDPLAGAVGNLAGARVDAAHDYPDTTRVSVGRGSAVWPTRPAAARLECYHHNLETAIVHAGVLLDAVRLASGQPAESLSEEVKALLRPVVNMLGLMYGGAKVKDMYRSNLIRRQIDASGLVPAISKLRKRLDVGGALS